MEPDAGDDRQMVREDGAWAMRGTSVAKTSVLQEAKSKEEYYHGAYERIFDDFLREIVKPV